jgi:inactivated superfamily I helicase
MPAAAIWDCVSDYWSANLDEAGATDPCERRPARFDAEIHR